MILVNNSNTVLWICIILGFIIWADTMSDLIVAQCDGVFFFVLFFFLVHGPLTEANICVKRYSPKFMINDTF